MKVNVKRKLIMLPLLAFSTWASANPVLLETSAMDRITAGTQTGLEHLANVLTAVRDTAGNLSPIDLLPALGAEQLAVLTKLAGNEPITFHLSQSGEFVATQQSQSGEQVVFAKQLDAADTASLRQNNPNEQVKTYTLGPGESLHLQETSAGGASYIYVYSSGNSTVTTSLKNGL